MAGKSRDIVSRDAAAGLRLDKARWLAPVIGTLAELDADLTKNVDKWQKRLARINADRMQFERDGVRMAGGALIEWRPFAAALPALPAVLAVVAYQNPHGDAALEALCSRGLWQWSLEGLSLGWWSSRAEYRSRQCGGVDQVPDRLAPIVTVALLRQEFIASVCECCLDLGRALPSLVPSAPPLAGVALHVGPSSPERGVRFIGRGVGEVELPAVRWIDWLQQMGLMLRHVEVIDGKSVVVVTFPELLRGECEAIREGLRAMPEESAPAVPPRPRTSRRPRVE